jgi:hypothetical protein
VRPGARLAKVARRLGVGLGLGRGFHIGLNTWYLTPAGASRGVVEVRHGMIEAIGIADKSLTANRSAARRLLSSVS